MRRRGDRWKAGTNVRREPDVAAMAAALARPGIDLSVWCFRGTVAAIKGDGSVDYGDPNTVVIAPRGIDVDVVAEPWDDPVTCRYGTSYGGMVLLGPIRTGNLVLCMVPQGDFSQVPEIVKVLGGPHTPMPVEDDGLPVFRNDRVLLYGDGVPVEVRASGGARVRVNTDGTVVVNQGTQAAARKGDAVEVTLSGLPPDPKGIYGLAAALLATGLFTPNPSPPPPSPQPSFEVDGQITGGSGTVKVG